MSQQQQIERLRRREDFVAAARGFFCAMPHVVVQMRRREDDGAARVGFTTTRKIGKAVARNRARRRLREVVRLLPPELLKSGHDYVFIARDSTATCDFSELMQQTAQALRRLNAGKGRISRPRSQRRRK